jgi:hypothetical protein
MKTTVIDQRTEDQKKTHYWAVIALDLSKRWSSRLNPYRCAWASRTLEEARNTFDRLKERGSVAEIIIADLRSYKPRSRDRCFHVYLCDGRHPSECMKTHAQPLSYFQTSGAEKATPGEVLEIFTEDGSDQLFITREEMAKYEQDQAKKIFASLELFVFMDLKKRTGARRINPPSTQTS